jgi:hypothetical protein
MSTDTDQIAFGRVIRIDPRNPRQEFFRDLHGRI